jgi:hypothetical protein
MIEIDNFYNNGFGWICKACERELAETLVATEIKSDSKLNRIMREGEAETKQPRLSNLALAKWSDVTKQSLMCPRCGIVEQVDKA